jgi:hypothetical protein
MEIGHLEILYEVSLCDKNYSHGHRTNLWMYVGHTEQVGSSDNASNSSEPARTAFLTEVACGSPCSLQANAEVVP